jgi:aryl-alcohol dehydrogenase-like predicted oxidoreductase
MPAINVYMLNVPQDNGVPLASNQIQYSLLYRQPERNGVADAIKDAGATLIAYSPLCQGLLTGRDFSRVEGFQKWSRPAPP